ncbi:MAG: ABC transporter ATP-binding protein [Bacteroidales bacterium]|nr:ABC transporter ATP-binding protein [Bacteroidales bacterium]
MATPLLQVRNLKVSFSRDGQWTEAVHGIDLDVVAGRTLGLVGESGSGKSVSSLSLMRLLNEKVSRISADSIQIEGEEIKDFTERQMADVRGKRISMIFQEPMTSLNPVYKCGFQVAEMILQHEGKTALRQAQGPSPVGKKAAKERVIELFKQVMLPRPEAIYDSYPHELSGGQKQRVMIAMAIACNPKLLIADEPTTALDVTVQLEILKLLRQLQKETGMGMIFITHDLGVVAEIADDVAVMHNGEILERGSVDQILNHPQHPYTQGLLACRPPMDVRLRRLPIVKEFLDGQWQGGKEQILRDLQISDEERQDHLKKLYSQPPLLKVEGLQTWYPLRKGVLGRVYDYVKAVDEVSLEVYEGETLGLVGESGCGKTTLGRSILRLAEPTGGKVWFDGIEVTALKGQALRDFRKQAQIVFQDPYSSLNPRMTIGEAIAEPMRVHGIHGRGLRPAVQNEGKLRDAICDNDLRDTVCELLEQVGLKAEHYDRYPHEFSGGQRQRICIARALAVNPRLVICDESVSALDVSVQAQVLNLLNRLKEERGLTYIFISHDLSVVRFMSDRVLVMYNGRPVEMNDADVLFEHPQNAYTKKLIAALPGRRSLR